MKRVLGGSAFMALMMAACGSDGLSSTSEVAEAAPATANGALPALYGRFAAGVSVAMSGSDVVIRSNGVPTHATPYFGPGHALYVAPHAGMTLNPFRIQTQALEFRVPAAPAVGTASATPLGAIGVTTTGLAMFNQYAAGFQPLDAEIRTFDLANGHPQGSGLYHHHLEPVQVTQADRTALVGVLLDGFPVYGPLHVDGAPPRDLDECNGHTGPTPDHPQGIYHYHVTASVPYISGCFRGTPGRATN
jgi:hypothetical protein